MFKKISNLGSGACVSLNLSIDKKFVVVATVNGITIHNAKTLEKIKYLKIDTTPDKVALSPDNKFVAYTTREKKVILLNLETHHADELFIESLDIPKSSFSYPKAYNYWISSIGMTSIFAVSFSPDGKLLLTGSYSHYRISNLVKTKNDTDLNTITLEYPFTIWNISSRKAKYTLYTKYEIAGTVFSEDSNYLATWSDAGFASLWDLRSGKLLCDIKNVEVREGFFSSDNLYFGSRGTFFNYITNVQSGELVSQYLIGPTETSGPTWLVEKPYSFLNTEELINRLPGYTPKISSLAISPDNKKLAVAGDQPRIYIWDIHSTSLITTLDISPTKEKSNYKFIGLDFSTDGKKLISIDTSVIFIWDITSNLLLLKYSDIKGGCGQFAPNGSCLAIGGERGMLSIYQIINGLIGKTPKWKKPLNDKNNLCFSNNSKYILTWGYTGNIQILNVESGDLLYEDSLQEKNWSGSLVPAKISCASFLPDDKRVIFGIAGKGFMVDIKSGLKKEIQRDTKGFYFNDQFIFTSDGTQIIDHYLSLYNTQDFKRISQTQVDDPYNHMVAISLSRDGKLFAAGGNYGVAYVWSTNDSKKQID